MMSLFAEWKRLFISLITASAVLLSVGGTAQARSTAANPPSTGASTIQKVLLSEGSGDVETLSASHVESLLKAAPTPESFVRSGHDIDPAAVTGYSYQGHQLVQFPLRGQSLVAPSALTLVFQNGSLQQPIEMVFTEHSPISGQVEIWVDGELVLDRTIVEDNTTVRPYLDWDKLNDCLARQGIPAWVISGVSTACAIACAITAGTGCILCLVGVVGLSTGVVSECVEEAS
jgi:hypothetical protein